MTREILYTDEAGNKLIRDHDGRLAVINRQGRFTNNAGFRKVAKEAGLEFKSPGKTRRGRGGVRITGGLISADENHPIWNRLNKKNNTIEDVFSGNYDFGLGI